jgi:hypothetical protein
MLLNFDWTELNNVICKNLETSFNLHKNFKDKIKFEIRSAAK